MLGLFVALTILLTDSKPLPPCAIIVPYVWLYGEMAAIKWAKEHGYTNIQITIIKKECKIGR